MAIPSQTAKGVRNLSNAMLLFMAFGGLIVVFLFAASPVIAQLATLDPSAPDPGVLRAISGSVLGFLATLCAIVAVALFGLFTGLMGVLAIRRGAGEFGPAHAKRVDQAMIMLVIGIIVPFVGAFFVPTTAFGLGNIGDIVLMFNAVMIAATMALRAAGTILIGLFLLWVAESLSTAKERRLGLYALIVGILGVALGGAANLAILRTVTLPTDTQNFSIVFFVPTAVSSGISILSIGLWYLAYRGVLERFDRGELEPVLPSAATTWAPPNPQGYWPPAQPVEPPDESPPERPRSPGP